LPGIPYIGDTGISEVGAAGVPKPRLPEIPHEKLAHGWCAMHCR